MLVASLLNLFLGLGIMSELVLPSACVEVPVSNASCVEVPVSQMEILTFVRMTGWEGDRSWY